MRRVLAAASIALLALAACSDQAATPGTPTGIPPANEVTPTAVCPSVDSVRALIRGLYAPGTKRTQANQTYTTIRNRLKAGNLPGATELTLILTRTVLADFYAGALTGGQASGTAARVSTFVDGLFCQVGLPSPGLSLDPDAVAGVVGPSSPATTLVTPTLYAGLQVPAAAAPKLTLITVRRLPDEPGPLLTPLDQYPAYYEYTATPPVTFGQDLVVGVCQADDFPPPQYDRFRIAHNVGPTVEILPLVPAPFLDCSTLLGSAPYFPGMRGYASRGWHWITETVLPKPAYASIMGGCCLGGSTKSFSPFGAVDPLTVVTYVPPLVLNGAPGSALPANDMPTIRLLTPNGRPVPGATVTFSLAPTSDGSITGATKVTNANGLVELDSWTLGTDNLPDSVFVTVTPLPGTSVQGNGGVFVANH